MTLLYPLRTHPLRAFLTNQGRLCLRCRNCNVALAYCDTWAEYLRLAAVTACPHCAPKVIYTLPVKDQP